MKKLSRNKKNLIIIGIIIVLTLIITIVVSNQKTSTIAQNFHIEDTKKVVRIVMEDRDGYKSELTKTNDSVWMVNNEFVAAPQMVKTLLETLRDMRVREPVAKSSPRMWGDIFKQNRENMLESIKSFEDQMNEAKKMIEDERYEELENWMKKANSLHEIL